MSFLLVLDLSIYYGSTQPIIFRLAFGRLSSCKLATDGDRDKEMSRPLLRLVSGFNNRHLSSEDEVKSAVWYSERQDAS
jgi:hypothetical protein